MITQRSLFALTLSLWLLAGVAQSAEDPQKAVIETADQVLAQVNAHRAELKADPGKLYNLVQTLVVPHFDFESMVRQSMGRYWRDASTAQRQQLIAQFQHMLIRAYGTLLLNFSSQQIEYPPMHTLVEGDRATVPTRVKPDGRPAVSVDYRLALKDDQWKVYDVKIEGASLLTNYRGSFASLIRQGASSSTGSYDERVSAGIDHLIQALVQKNAANSQ